ncbi:hypothetical protein Tco_0184190 [Tanacetum coccineum]
MRPLDRCSPLFQGEDPWVKRITFKGVLGYNSFKLNLKNNQQQTLYSCASPTWGDYGVAGDDYEGPIVFADDRYEEESMPVYDTDIEKVIEEEEGFIGKGGFGREEDNIEDVVVVANWNETDIQEKDKK